MIEFNRRRFVCVALSAAFSSNFALLIPSEADADVSPTALSTIPDLSTIFAGATITADATINLLPDLIQGGTPLIFYADQITLAGNYQTRGSPIALIARTVSIGAATVFDVSGDAGQPSYAPKNRASDGSVGHVDGSPAKIDGTTDGGRGGDAGVFFLSAGSLSGSMTIIANGGNGGRGRDGGNGANGQNQPDQTADCAAGLNGGNGGIGGAGGDGGSGGNGGTVIIRTATSVSPDSLTITVQGGAGGSPGTNGTSGGPGTGGNGGPPYVPYTRPIVK